MEDEHYLNFMDAYLDEKYLYAVSYENILFRAKKGNVYNAEILEVINGFQNKCAKKIYAVQYYKNSLYMFLDSTYEVARYDFDIKKLFYYYPVGYNPIFGSEGKICRIKNDVWIMQDIFEKKLCIFSLESCEYRFFDLDISALQNNIERKKVKYISKEKVCVVGNKVWRCVPGTDYLYNIDVETKKIDFYKTGADIDIYTISHDKEGFNLISLYGEIVIRWDEDKGVISKIKVGEKKQFEAFRDILCMNQCYILIPFKTDEIKVLSKEGEIIGKCELPSKFRRMKGVKRGVFLNYHEDEEKVLLFPFGGNGMIEVNKATLETRYCPVCVSQKEYMEILLALDRNIIERETLSLDNYIGLLQIGQHLGKDPCNYAGTIGRQIMRMAETTI